MDRQIERQVDIQIMKEIERNTSTKKAEFKSVRLFRYRYNRTSDNFNDIFI